MKKNDTVVLTTSFSQPQSFTDDFFSSLNSQSRDDFDLLIVNDGYDGLSEELAKYPDIVANVVAGTGNIAKNRQSLINTALEMDYAYAIFADFDDYLSDNRVEISLFLLRRSDIVVNDLSIVENNRVSKISLFDGILTCDTEIQMSMVLESNIFGLTNTAIRLNPIKPVSFDEDLKAVDWYFFTSLLLDGLKATYTDQCFTFYRQHQNGMSNIGTASLNQLKKEIDVKTVHYSLLATQEPTFGELLLGVEDFVLQSKEFAQTYFELINKNNKKPFWWNIFNIEEYWKTKNEINKKS